MTESISLASLLEWKETRKFFLYPFLPTESTMFIAAPPKSLKTLLTMQLAYNLAAGADFLGWQVDHPVEHILYVEQEIGRSETRDRMMRFHKHYNKPEVLDRIRFVTRPKQRYSLDRGSKGLLSFKEELEEYRPEIVILDPFRKMTSSDENSSTEMTKVFATLTELQQEYNFATILIHHSSKPSEARKQGTPEAMRGSSEIFAHGDTYMMVTKPNDKANTDIDVHLTFRHAPDIDPIKLSYSDNSVFVRRSTQSAATSKSDIRKNTGSGKLTDADSTTLKQSLKGLKVTIDSK